MRTDILRDERRYIFFFLEIFEIFTPPFFPAGLPFFPGESQPVSATQRRFGKFKALIESPGGRSAGTARYEGAK